MFYFQVDESSIAKEFLFAFMLYMTGPASFVAITLTLLLNLNNQSGIVTLDEEQPLRLV